MPDWPMVPLGGLVDLLTGFAFKSAEFSSTGIRLARGDNVKRGVFEWGSKARFWPTVTPELERYQLRAGDVLIGMDGSRVGENWARVNPADLPCLLVQRVARLRARSDLDQQFLWHLISNVRFVEYIKSAQTGSAIPHISGGQIKAFLVPCPPPCEQKRIAELLGALDDKIDLNRRMNETIEAMARAIFKDWFVDFGPTRAKMEGRPPYLAPDIWALFPDRLDGEGKPEEWGEGPLGTAAEVIMGASPDGATYNDEGNGVPLVNGPVEYGSYFLRKVKWTTAPTRMSKAGDFIICVRGSTTGRHCYADGEYCPVSCSNRHHNIEATNRPAVYHIRYGRRPRNRRPA